MNQLPGDAAPADEALLPALREALARGELRLAYQPQVCLTTGSVVGVEALLRWRSPQWGEVPPDRFVPVAERHGLIVEIGAWVLHEACRQAAAWLADGLPALRVSVNFSPLQLQHDDMAARVQQALAATGLAPSALGLEVTESALLHNTEQVAAVLRGLQAQGIEIAIDDFGTGYSSLGRLRDLPIDVVKIDRSFVHDVTAAPAAASISRAVIHLAHGLHLRVLAEGVETEEQLRLLLEHGCDRIQGHYFATALEPQALAELLRSRTALPRELTHRRERVRTLLLVDDEESILAALRRVFRRDGYRVLTASGGAQALELLATQPVHVILSDQRMPGMSGVDFLRRAKALYPDTVRMTLSGYTDLETIIDAVNEGAVYKFLTKPWDDDRLRGHVARAFEVSELTEENRRLAREIGSANTELAVANRRLAQLLDEQRERAQAMQAAAGGVLDLVDALPVAVFGIDDEGLLVHVNRVSVRRLPDWAADIGTEAPAELRTLRDHLAQVARHAPALTQPGQVVQLAGMNWHAWRCPLAGRSEPRGDLLVLVPDEPVSHAGAPVVLGAAARLEVA